MRVQLRGEYEVGIVEISTDHGLPLPVVLLSGEHDASTRRRLDEALEEVLTADELLVDLFDVTFLDAAIVSAFVRAAHVLHERGGVLHVVVKSGSVADRLFGLLQVPEMDGVALLRSRREPVALSPSSRNSLRLLLEESGTFATPSPAPPRIRAAQLRKVAATLDETGVDRAVEMQMHEASGMAGLLVEIYERQGREGP